MTRPWSETVPTVEQCARRMLPILWRLRNAGWVGLSERDRDQITDDVWDLERALERLK